MVYPFNSPFTPKMFSTHLDRMKQWASPKRPSFSQDNSSDNDNTTTQTPTPYSMSPPITPSSSLKRNVTFEGNDESPSKRARTQLHPSPATKRQLVPVFSRQETNAHLQVLQEFHDDAPGSGGENDFVVARADVPAIVRHEDDLSNWRSDDMEPPSAFMNDEAEDSLFPALGGMSSYALDAEDLDFTTGPEYGQEGIDDGGETVQLDADGLPFMDDEPVQEPAEEPANAEPAAKEAKQPVVVYDLDDSDDDADMDAFIAEANGTQTYRLPIKPVGEAESAESSDVVEAPARPPQISRVQNLDGIQKLVNSDGQVDQFIIETGATPEREEQHIEKRSLDDGSSTADNIHDARQENDKQVVEARRDAQPRDAEPTQLDEPDLQIIDQNDTALTQSFKVQGYKYQHPSERPATPPLPTSSIAAGPETSAATYNVNKTAASTSALRVSELAKLAGTDGPVAGRDHCKILNAYQQFYSRTIQYIPNLPHWKEFEWSRRYWIAVLYANKKPKTASKAKDFMWMKGNCYSTISTIWHNYALRTMEEDFVLTCRGELTDMKDQVAELDWFNQKFVVLRAVKKDTRDFEKIRGLATDVGVVPEFAPVEPGEVIEILDD